MTSDANFNLRVFILKMNNKKIILLIIFIIEKLLVFYEPKYHKKSRGLFFNHRFYLSLIEQ